MSISLLIVYLRYNALYIKLKLFSLYNHIFFMKVSKTGLKPVFGFPRKPVLTSLIVVEGHCTSCFIGVACFSCRRHVDVHKEGISFRWTGVRVVKALHFLVDVING